MNLELVDWNRLRKALEVEEKHGFTNILGKQYRFHEFLKMSFGNPPNGMPKEALRQWQELENAFVSYPNLSRDRRQELVERSRQLIGAAQQVLKQGNAPLKAEDKLKLVPAINPAINHRNIQECNQKVSEDFVLEKPLMKLDGCGAKNAQLLALLNLYTVRDVLFYYPRDHVDYARQVMIDELEAGETVTVVGKLKRVNCFTSPKNKKLTILDLQVKDETGQLKISRFFAGNYYSSRQWQERLKRSYPLGAIVAASGLVKKSKYGITLDKPELEVLDSSGSSIESIKIGRVVPVYPLTEGVAADVVRKAVMSALPAADKLRDPLPDNLRERYDLIGLSEGIVNIHFPDNSDSLRDARRRLIFDEFFYLQLGFMKRRYTDKQSKTKVQLAPKGELIGKFDRILSFELTGAQKRVVNEIFNDLQSATPMNRLIQGDVGSGKTVVAVIAILAAIQSGYQAALMAPTEVLAEQHYRKLVNWFNLLHLPVELLTGSTKIAKRREIHSQLETGELPLLVGTHALIQDTVNFQRLGLVVIDEQHRFGVGQRARLQQKGEAPHVLTMTATPIPRTLALTIHGDLDVSQIDELPPGRKPIQTTTLTGRERRQAYELIRREIALDRQVYIVLPLVEESEKLEVRSAIEEHKRLSESIFPEFELGLLHGRMNSAEKDDVISKFRDNKSQILVATTVVEVGVDVPNATVMLIENAERFGLSQLHQLRGRVGRGDRKSYCLLMNGSKTPEARQRLGVLEQSQDGFFISEMDMRLRGPGEVLGTRQSGLPDFALASLVEDQDVLVLARDAAEKIISDDAKLTGFPLLQEELDRRYQRLMGGTIMT